jgi:serine/tyrosine/threonine adenylyltransferase
VLNSDNINATGESFDYGPWRFTPDWDPDFTAAYFDHYGLYSFGRQPEAIHWDLAQFAGCMSLIAEAPPLSDMLAGWSDRFEDELLAALLRRLGVRAKDRETDRSLTAALLRALQSREVQIDRLFFDWRGGRDPGIERYPTEHFRSLASALEGREEEAPQHAYWSGAAPCSMHIEEVESIWSAIAENDDWRPFERKVAAIRRMGEAMSDERTAT